MHWYDHDFSLSVAYKLSAIWLIEKSTILAFGNIVLFSINQIADLLYATDKRKTWSCQCTWNYNEFQILNCKIKFKL